MNLMEMLIATLGVGGGSKVDEALLDAQECIYDAWEAPTLKKKLALARQALKLSADCADTYLLLSDDPAIDEAQKIDLLRQAVAAGERALGEEYFKENEGHFWGLIDTRPYMRALCAMGIDCRRRGLAREATEIFQKMLRLNPEDNQGVRDTLLPLLIETGCDKDAERLYKQYREQYDAAWYYSRALLDFRKSGDSAKARQALAEAIELNPHLPRFLLNPAILPARLPELFSTGNEDEAIIVAVDSLKAWENTPNALEWLAAHAALAAAPPPQP